MCISCRPPHPVARKPYSKDGRMAIAICFMAAVANILLAGCVMPFGIIFPVLLKQFGTGKAETAWVGSLALALGVGFGPVVAKLLHRFGARAVTIAGSMVAALGLFVTSQVNDVIPMYFTYSIPCGFGTCCVLVSGFDVVSKYFEKWLSLATAFTHMGSVVSLLVMSPLIEALLAKMGWRSTFMVMGGFACVVPLFGVFYSPDVEPDRMNIGDVNLHTCGASEDKNEQTPELKLRYNKRLWICCASGFILDFGGTIPLIYLGLYSQDMGISPEHSALLYVGYSVGSALARIVTGRVCDLECINPVYTFSLSALVCGVSNIICPHLTSFAALMAYFTVNGLANGGYATSVFMVVYQTTFQPDMRTRALGVYLFIVSVAFASGPPIGGFLADFMDSYVPVFYLSGSLLLLSGMTMLSIKYVKPQWEGLSKKECQSTTVAMASGPVIDGRKSSSFCQFLSAV